MVAIWSGPREPAEHYWEQLRQAGLRWRRWSGDDAILS